MSRPQTIGIEAEAGLLFPRTVGYPDTFLEEFPEAPEAPEFLLSIQGWDKTDAQT